MNCQSVLQNARRSAAFGALLLVSATTQGAIAQNAIAQNAVAQNPVRKVSIRFQPMVGAQKFECGRSYAGIGTTGATITPSDFALYVHDVKLVTTTGTEVAVQLEQDGVFQNGSVALLDFENGAGACSNGNAAVHHAVVGTVPEGKYSGVRFTIGVPFDRNHLDLTTQPSPLSVTRMFWAWNSGHKFARFDSKAANGKSWVLHLGSGGCMPTGSAVRAPTSCAQENRVTIDIAEFDVERDAIVADAASLFAGNGGTGDQVCMSSLKTASCAPMFAALGIPFNAPVAKPQTFLRKQAISASAQGELK